MPLFDIFGGIFVWVIIVAIAGASFFISDWLEDKIGIPTMVAFVPVMIGIAYLIDAIFR